jgi:hypothetical protein
VNDCWGPGAAYVYVKPANGWQTMTETAELTPSTAGNTNFGQGVAIAGNETAILVGQPNYGICGPDSCPPGQVNIYLEPIGGWVNANENSSVNALDSEANDGFGSCLSSVGNTVAVGGSGSDGDYILTFASGNLTQIAQLTYASGGYSNAIACPMALTMGWLFATDQVESRHGQNYGGGYNYFAVFAFKEPRSGWVDSNTIYARLAPYSNPANTEDNFGVALAATAKAGGALIVGANAAIGVDGSGCAVMGVICPGPGQALVYTK